MRFTIRPGPGSIVPTVEGAGACRFGSRRRFELVGREGTRQETTDLRLGLRPVSAFLPREAFAPSRPVPHRRSPTIRRSPMPGRWRLRLACAGRFHVEASALGPLRDGLELGRGLRSQPAPRPMLCICPVDVPDSKPDASRQTGSTTVSGENLSPPEGVIPAYSEILFQETAVFEY